MLGRENILTNKQCPINKFKKNENLLGTYDELAIDR